MREKKVLVLRTVGLLFRFGAVLCLLGFFACGTAASRGEAAVRDGSVPTIGTSAPTALPDTPNPVRLVIPAIGVRASIESVGVNTNGDLATPTDHPWDDAGWYNSGPRPGEQGSAVIDGHVDRPGGLPAVFWNLWELQVGDIILVANAAGTTRIFHVTRRAFYQPQEAPLQDIFGNRGGTYLNLITCAGDWIPSQQQTSLRLVVYSSSG